MKYKQTSSNNVRELEDEILYSLENENKKIDCSEIKETENENLVPIENNFTIKEDEPCDNKIVQNNKEKNTDLSEFVIFNSHNEPPCKKRKIEEEEKNINKNRVLLRPVALNQSSINMTNTKFVKLTVSNDQKKDDRIMAHIQPVNINSTSSVASGKSTPVELFDILKITNEKNLEGDLKYKLEKDLDMPKKNIADSNDNVNICKTIK